MLDLATFLVACHKTVVVVMFRVQLRSLMNACTHPRRRCGGRNERFQLRDIVDLLARSHTVCVMLKLSASDCVVSNVRVGCHTVDVLLEAKEFNHVTL